MRMPDVDPVVKVDPRDGSTRTSHPAFGQIRASRVSGHTALYGSDFIHNNYVTISICESDLMRTHSNDWHFGGKGLIEVALSEAGWATFVSAMNVGSGVPCTLERVAGESKPNIALRRQEAHFKAETNEAVKAAMEHLRALRIKIADAANGLSKAKQSNLLSEIDMVIRQVGDHLPFVVTQFDEHVETTMEKAKVELHGYMQGIVARAGIAALGEQKRDPLMLIEDAE